MLKVSQNHESTNGIKYMRLTHDGLSLLPYNLIAPFILYFILLIMKTYMGSLNKRYSKWTMMLVGFLN